MGENLAGVLHEDAQDVVLLRRELYLPALDRDDALSQALMKAKNRAKNKNPVPRTMMSIGLAPYFRFALPCLQPAGLKSCEDTQSRW
ncbi:hypothetical protein [Mesorhizobium sp. AA22]|uniref:hypothetical protein n=1 Tax=Mesorhizobium sp. AA22 TaxID=1854057 RepID=UPI0013980CFE|nr:hypothetical protein [Mesorhizobium sp. AA22]QIA21841.1 hypothetical protein A9K68_008435 [Mesorhizobium sp. AA22]